VAEDPYEPNDTRATAALISSTPGADSTGDLPGHGTGKGETSIYPAGDDDWYVWANTCRQNWLFSSPNEEVVMDLYVNGLLYASDFIGGVTLSPGCRNIEIRLHSATASAYSFFGSPS
jgi:hypothetical protein